MLKRSGKRKLILNVIGRVALSAVLAFSAVAAILFTNYKVVYRVFVNGNEVGYIGSKIAMEKKIDDFVQNGDDSNVAYVVMNAKVDYELMLLKRDTALTDGSVLTAIKDTCDVYHNVYALNVGGEEKFLVESPTAQNPLSDFVTSRELGSSWNRVPLNPANFPPQMIRAANMA